MVALLLPLTVPLPPLHIAVDLEVVVVAAVLLVVVLLVIALVR